MGTNGVRAAIYLRVSRDDQTTENRRLVLAKVAEHRGWLIVQTYEDQGISGAKGRDQRPAFDTMLKDAVRRRFDVLMVWSIDRLGCSVLHVANALAELDAAGVALYSDQQVISALRRKAPDGDPGKLPLAQGGLPLLHVERGFGQAVHLPCLPATAIPIDPCVPQRDKPQRQIVAVEAFRVPADRDNRH